jgi:hypothetical protein
MAEAKLNERINMVMPDQKPPLEKFDYPLASFFGLEAYKTHLPIDALRRFALTSKTEEKHSIANWIELWFKSLDWQVKHNTEYDRLTKKRPKDFLEWLEGKEDVECAVFKDLKDNALRMTWIEGVDMECVAE